MELKNSEHYNDPTPYEAHKNIRKEEQLEAARMRTISALVSALKQVADLAGFEIVAGLSLWIRILGGFSDEYPKVRDVRTGHTERQEPPEVLP